MIRKYKDAEPTEFEEAVAQALFDLENTNQGVSYDSRKQAVPCIYCQKGALLKKGDKCFLHGPTISSTTSNNDHCYRASFLEEGFWCP